MIMFVPTCSLPASARRARALRTRKNPDRAATVSRAAKFRSTSGNDTYGGLEFRRAPVHQRRFLLLLLMLLFSGSPICAQEAFDDHRVRLLLDTEVGSETQLGYNFPSISLGSSFEAPIANRFEIQSSWVYSPDHKTITNDGHLATLDSSAIFFVNKRMGFVGGMKHDWLWTSQFDKTASYPTAGIVLRNDYLGRGRLYLRYVFPTGCVAATSSNPCKIQSNRLQGLTIRQEARSVSHVRWGIESGLYHFCDQGNPNEPEAGRHCHWGATALVLVRFEFHCGSRSRFASVGESDSDNF